MTTTAPDTSESWAMHVDMTAAERRHPETFPKAMATCLEQHLINLGYTVTVRHFTKVQGHWTTQEGLDDVATDYRYEFEVRPVTPEDVAKTAGALARRVYTRIADEEGFEDSGVYGVTAVQEILGLDRETAHQVIDGWDD